MNKALPELDADCCDLHRKSNSEKRPVISAETTVRRSTESTSSFNLKNRLRNVEERTTVKCTTPQWASKKWNKLIRFFYIVESIVNMASKPV
jgi:hypothetical protein